MQNPSRIIDHVKFSRNADLLQFFSNNTYLYINMKILGQGFALPYFSVKVHVDAIFQMPSGSIDPFLMLQRRLSLQATCVCSHMQWWAKLQL